MIELSVFSGVPKIIFCIGEMTFYRLLSRIKTTAEQEDKTNHRRCEMNKLIVAATVMLCVLMTFPAVGLALEIDIGGGGINIRDNDRDRRDEAYI